MPSTKQELIKQLLANGMITILLNPRTPGIILPPYVVQQDSVALNLSWNFRNCPMALTEEAIVADLSFSGVITTCRIPWEAVIYAKQEDRIYRFIGDIPILLVGQPSEAKSLKAVEGGGELTQPRQGHLHLVH